MDTTTQIEKFLRDIRLRNRREIILGILAIPLVIGMMSILVLFTDNAPVGSLKFFGFLLIILATLFNIGMMWFVASPSGDLSSHPASNVNHWAAEMLRQAKLLALEEHFYDADPTFGHQRFLSSLTLLAARLFDPFLP